MTDRYNRLKLAIKDKDPHNIGLYTGLLYDLESLENERVKAIKDLEKSYQDKKYYIDFLRVIEDSNKHLHEQYALTIKLLQEEINNLKSRSFLLRSDGPIN